MKKTLLPIIAMTVLTACETQTLAEYRPVVDTSRVDTVQYERDLSECRNVAFAAEAEYKDRQAQEMGANMMAGILVGAIAGAAIGNGGNDIAAGAAYGAGVGAAGTDTELAYGGPRRIIDRCMSERGYAILNDIGRG
ncbi:glycine zipper family protein [Celeribacter sp.]|uniref:glycine zipper family protein n=1 Tax=Celeribacter sp. TaxID=1890673 RepID=UPI003A9562C6